MNACQGKESDKSAVLKMIYESVKNHEELITVVHIDSALHGKSKKHYDEKGQIFELDEGLLIAFMKKYHKSRKADKNYRQRCLYLALIWNRLDIAKRYILKATVGHGGSLIGGWSGIKDFEPNDFEELMNYALLEDRAPFVRYFLAEKDILREYVTCQRLKQLYGKVFPNSITAY